MPGEKTEKATPKRREEERKKGNIFQSKDIVTIFSLLIMFYSLQLLLPGIAATIQAQIIDYIDLLATQETLIVSSLTPIFLNSALTFLVTALPLLLISMVTTVLFTAAQTKLLFSMKSMAFKPSRLNPLQGLKKMVSMRGLVELVKSMTKISVLGLIIYLQLIKRISLLPRLTDLSLQESVKFMGDTIMAIVNNVAAIFLVVAVLDYVYQWWDYEKNLRMSKQDIKEEYKQMEGDPQVKGKIKDMQRQRARNRMMQSVPSADVVIRNPTHFAVAISYDPKENRAPIVVAKGADLVALRIVTIAEENNIVITENKPLARGLYETVDIDMEIPDQFYQAVAEVLAFVYSLKQKDLN